MLATEALAAQIPEKREAPMGGGGHSGLNQKAPLARVGPFFAYTPRGTRGHPSEWH